jgi:uncharacterized repeat protein (TIGR03803 family)
MHSKRFSHFIGVAAAALVAAAMAVSTAGASNAQMVLYAFTGGNDGGNAATGLVFDAQGNAYGTTVVGGGAGCGTIFELTPSQGQWTETTLWSFSCGVDGKNPHGGVTLDANGDLFGTTVAGGSGGACTGDGCGVVFELSKGVLTPIYSFRGQRDGFGPGGPVSFDAAGNLYGTTPDGGPHQMGVVYQLSLRHGAWTYTMIHGFTGRRDGAVGSLGALLVDSHGSLFGIAELGGDHQAGTAYRLTPGAGGTWTFTTLYAFKGMPNAGFPYGGLIADPTGDLFGTTYYGGRYGLGSVFELVPGAPGKYSERVLHSFKGLPKDGSAPTSTLAFDSAGDLLGTTSAGGGSCDCGTIFELAAGTGKETIVHRFGSTSSDGAYPYYGLTPFGGNLYTSTVAGGSFGQGTIYGLTP